MLDSFVVAQATIEGNGSGKCGHKAVFSVLYLGHQAQGEEALVRLVYIPPRFPVGSIIPFPLDK